MNYIQKYSPVRKISVIALGLLFSLITLEMGIRATGLARTMIQKYYNTQRLKKNGVLRIVCLGDSMTEIGYPAFLERALNTRSETVKYSVINKGLSITGTSYAASILDDCIKEYDPWMIIVMSGIQDVDDLVIGGNEDSRKTAFYENLKVYRLFMLVRKEVKYKFEEMKNLKTPQLPAESQVPDFQQCLFLGSQFVNQEKYAEAEEMYNKAIALSPEKPHAYWKLKELYAGRMNDPVKAEQWLKGLIQAHPDNDIFHNLLADVYLAMKKTGKAKECFAKTVAFNRQNAGAWFCLLQLSRQGGGNNEFTQFKDMLDTNGDRLPENFADRLYGAAAVHYLGEKKYALSDAYFSKAEEMRSKISSKTIRNNYRTIAEKVLSKNIKLVIMQYPMRSIQPLKDMMQSHKNIIFIDNERLFKDALKQGSFDEYFVDQFAGDFGHYSAKGMELLSEHMADIILENN